MVILAADGRRSTSGSAPSRLIKGPVKIVSGVMEEGSVRFSATMGHNSHRQLWTATNSHLHEVNSHHRQPCVVEEIQ